MHGPFAGIAKLFGVGFMGVALACVAVMVACALLALCIGLGAAIVDKERN